MNYFDAVLETDHFYIHDKEVNGTGPVNSLTLGVVNLSTLKLDYFIPGTTLDEGYIYLNTVEIFFNMGEETDCLLQKEHVSGLILNATYPWGSNATSEIISNSCIKYSPSLLTMGVMAAGNAVEKKVEVKYFMIEGLVSETVAGVAPIQVEIKYAYKKEGSEQNGAESFGLIVRKEPPKLEILRFYASNGLVSGAEKAKLKWDATCADSFMLEKDGTLLNTVYTDPSGTDIAIQDNTVFSLVAMNKKNRIQYPARTSVIEYTPEDLELTVNGSESNCNVRYGDSLTCPVI